MWELNAGEHSMQDVRPEFLQQKTATGTLVELVAISEGWFGGDESSEKSKRSKTGSRDSRVETVIMCCGWSGKRGRRIGGGMDVY